MSAPWTQGYQANARDKLPTDCPYFGGMERNQWLLGWVQADVERYERSGGVHTVGPHYYYTDRT